MNKNDFLDILRDYLKGTFSELEINDILRDYEEFFLNGELQGKSDEEIIKGLGSPKSIAKELIEEMKGHKAGARSDNNERFEKVNREAKRVWKTVKGTGKKAGDKAKEFLDSNSVINGGISSVGVKIIMGIITIAIAIIAMPLIFTLIGGFLTLIGISLGNLIGYVGAVVLLGISLPMGIFGLFICITWTGFLILGWSIYILAYRGLKYLWIKYISWIRTRKMYIRVKEEQKSRSKEENRDLNEMNPVESEVINEDEVEVVEPMFLEDLRDGNWDEINKEVKGYDE